MDIISLGGDIYVQLSFLKKYGVNAQSIINGMNRNRKNKTKRFEHFVDSKDKRVKWIKYSSISRHVFLKYNLPWEENLSEAIELWKKEKIDNLILNKFEHAIEIGYRIHIKDYHGPFYEFDLIHQYARNHAVFIQIQQLRSFSIQINQIFQIYKQLDNMVFKTNSLKVFYAKLKKFEQYGSESLIHRGLGKAKNDRKLTDTHLDQIKKLYKDKSQWSYRDIQEKLNSWALLNGYSKVSVSTVKQILANKYIQNQCKPIRNGVEWEKLYLKPYRIREEPETNGELWQMDGSRFQFAYRDHTNGISFLTLFLVMDVHSRMIIGYSFGKSENHQIVIEALRMAAEKTKYLPILLIRDGSGCYRHIKYKKLEQHMSALGTSVREHPPQSPNEKGHIESFFGVFQTTVCKGNMGYLGEGIKSKRESGRPSREVLIKALKPANLRTQKELIQLLKELIVEYNNKSTNPIRKPPVIRYAVGEIDKYVYKLNENEIALMFWSRYQHYHVHKSMVLLSEGSFRNNQFQYIIYDKELQLRLNDTIVIVCYQKHDRSRIKLFDENERFITDVSYSRPVKIVRRDKENKGSISHIEGESNHVIHKENNPKQIPNKHQLYKRPGPPPLDVILIKTKGNDE